MNSRILVITIMQGNSGRKLEIALIKLATVATDLAFASVQLNEVAADQVNSEIESIVRRYIRLIFARNPQFAKPPHALDEIIAEMTQVALGGYCGASFAEFGDANTIKLFRKELEVTIAIVTREYTKKRAHLRAIHGVFA